jgi:hypothetical protein
VLAVAVFSAWKQWKHQFEYQYEAVRISFFHCTVLKDGFCMNASVDSDGQQKLSMSAKAEAASAATLSIRVAQTVHSFFAVSGL